jgi:perosamine synthetase
MNIVAIIQARTGSTRLPNKVLMKIKDKPVIAHIINRICGSRYINSIVVATTVNPADDVLVEYINTNTNCSVFRGSEENVLDRFYFCAKKHSADIIVRITADDPLKDAEIIDKAINMLLSDSHMDYVSNTITPTYPEGLDVEVFRFRALQKAFNEAESKTDKEHVTPYIWRNPGIFTIKNFEYEENLSGWRWTLDKPEDFEFITRIYDRFYNDKKAFSFKEVITYLKVNFDIQKINLGTVRNEGYLRSLKEKNELMNISKRIYGNELKYVMDVLNTDFRSSQGSLMTKRLEEEFAKRFSMSYAISHVNGTATMHSLLESIGIQPGDEVIVPPLTMSSTTFVVLQANATPVFADVEPDTFVIDAKSIETRITDKTKAIITVSLYGLSPDMDTIMEIAKKHNLFVIEDNAECLLGEYKGRMVGTLGHAASFSFQSSKHITSGEGGMVITNDLSIAESVRKVSSLGYAGVSATKGKITKIDIQDPDYARHIQLGWNYRMSELCAAVALAQLENIDELVQRRIGVAKLFDKVINDLECMWLVPQKEKKDYKNTYWTYVVKLQHPTISWHVFRNKFIELGGDGIYAAWRLAYLEPMFQNIALLGREKFISVNNINNYKKGLCPNAELLQPQLLQFKTNYWDWKKAEVQAEILAKVIKYFK